MLEALLESLTLRYILVQTNEIDWLALGVPYKRDVRQAPYLVPIGVKVTPLERVRRDSLVQDPSYTLRTLLMVVGMDDLRESV